MIYFSCYGYYNYRLLYLLYCYNYPSLFQARFSFFASPALYFFSGSLFLTSKNNSLLSKCQVARSVAKHYPSKFCLISCGESWRRNRLYYNWTTISPWSTELTKSILVLFFDEKPEVAVPLDWLIVVQSKKRSMGLGYRGAGRFT